MTRVHRTTVSLALTRASLLGLHGYLILAAHHDDRTYTLLVTDGEVTQLATGRLTPSGRSMSP
ncbi:hypothetical protein GCM10008955_41050 [Deinococcus malanensis]|uniref:Uncharacterized protein n=1 Tax=Deinococcus malanensis TaxID=1706855 RepID=A0ABQ2F2M1_9DEIO|nr:hypothetical protein [Deinococcus malanensis]GGK43072.1 hypothetical protein GCM10008955_41050 [Deinococcus malanensis]